MKCQLIHKHSVVSGKQMNSHTNTSGNGPSETSIGPRRRTPPTINMNGIAKPMNTLDHRWVIAIPPALWLMPAQYQIPYPRSKFGAAFKTDAGAQAEGALQRRACGPAAAS